MNTLYLYKWLSKSGLNVPVGQWDRGTEKIIRPKSITDNKMVCSMYL